MVESLSKNQPNGDLRAAVAKAGAKAAAQFQDTINRIADFVSSGSVSDDYPESTETVAESTDTYDDELKGWKLKMEESLSKNQTENDLWADVRRAGVEAAAKFQDTVDRIADAVSNVSLGDNSNTPTIAGMHWPEPSVETVTESTGTYNDDILDSREAIYGDAMGTHADIADVWSGILGRDILPHEVALMMAGLKLVRVGRNPHIQDSWDDLERYVRLARLIYNEEMISGEYDADRMKRI